MTDDLTPEEAMAAVPLLVARILRLEAALLALSSAGYARKRPAIIDVTPIRRQEEVP